MRCKKGQETMDKNNKKDVRAHITALFMRLGGGGGGVDVTCGPDPGTSLRSTPPAPQKIAARREHSRPGREASVAAFKGRGKGMYVTFVHVCFELYSVAFVNVCFVLYMFMLRLRDLAWHAMTSRQRIL